MRISMIVNPLTDLNLQRAAQVGTTDLVAVYPGPGLQPLMDLKERCERFGLKLSVMERKVPHLKFVHRRPGWEAEIADFKTLIRNMGEAGMEVLCYNWMPAEDWQRTRSDAPERAGSLVTAFNLAEVGRGNVTDADGLGGDPTSAEALWDNLERFLNEVVPVAEEAGIRLALHPDDPPLPEVSGQPQIIIGHEAYARVLELVDSPANALCYCQGTMASASEDIPAGIRRFGDRIAFGHFRDVVGTADDFRETWTDNGKTDMAEAMRAWRDIGFTGTIRPDHAPSMAGETNETPGYEMLGRLFAVGYMKGLWDAVTGED